LIFIPIPRERIPQEWPRILELIGPAVEMNADTPSQEVYEWLTSGRSEAFWVGVYPNCTGVCITTIIRADDECVCFIEYAAGTIKGGPRKFIETVRLIVGDIETLARNVGCTEVRAGGRNWLPIFDGWDPVDDSPNKVRKRLDG
jgi:hypothetical protein